MCKEHWGKLHAYRHMGIWKSKTFRNDAVTKWVYPSNRSHLIVVILRYCETNRFEFGRNMLINLIERKKSTPENSLNSNFRLSACVKQEKSQKDNSLILDLFKPVSAELRKGRSNGYLRAVILCFLWQCVYRSWNKHSYSQQNLRASQGSHSDFFPWDVDVVWVQV